MTNSGFDINSKWGLRSIGCVFFCLGGIATIVSIYAARWDYSLHNDDWIYTTGIVQNAKRESFAPPPAGWAVECDYSYVLDNTEYFSDRVSVGLTGTEEYARLWKRICCAKNKQINVWVRTRKDEDGSNVSVLINPKERTYWGSVLLLSISIALLVGGGCWWWVSDK